MSSRSVVLSDREASDHQLLGLTSQTCNKSRASKAEGDVDAEMWSVCSERPGSLGRDIIGWTDMLVETF